MSWIDLLKIIILSGWITLLLVILVFALGEQSSQGKPRKSDPPVRPQYRRPPSSRGGEG